MSKYNMNLKKALKIKKLLITNDNKINNQIKYTNKNNNKKKQQFIIIIHNTN